jgi:hypothetical protein
MSVKRKYKYKKITLYFFARNKSIILVSDFFSDFRFSKGIILFQKELQLNLFLADIIKNVLVVLSILTNELTNQNGNG